MSSISINYWTYTLSPVYNQIQICWPVVQNVLPPLPGALNSLYFSVICAGQQKMRLLSAFFLLAAACCHSSERNVFSTYNSSSSQPLHTV